jgi:hypothetical protein
LPDGVSATNSTAKVTRVFKRPDASKVREFADDIRDGKFVLPISRRLPLQLRPKRMHWPKKVRLASLFW